MTNTPKLVLTVIALVAVSAVVTPQKWIALAKAIVQCAQTLEGTLPVKVFRLRQLDPTCPLCL